MNFIILKINGVDVRQMLYDEAVQFLLKCPDPILVEIRRHQIDDIPEKHCTSNQPNIPHYHYNTKEYVSTEVQTDPLITEFVFTDTAFGQQPHELNIFEEALEPQIDIEEVTLRKSKSSERLGLTVSYSSGNLSGSDDTDTCTEVYISDIIPNSLAARDGRLRQGDQILQINGRDVTNKEETETLIAENKNAVTLLVSRCLYTDDDFKEAYEFYDDDDRSINYHNCVADSALTQKCFIEKNLSEHMNTSLSNKSNEHIPILLNNKEFLSALSAIDPLNNVKTESHLESVNQEIDLLDSRIENIMLCNKVSIQQNPTLNINNICTLLSTQNNLNTYNVPIDNMQKDDIDKTNDNLKSIETSAIPLIESETEHIYETIPEDIESEPLYCSPYSSSNQNLVEQWLGLQNDGSSWKALRKKLQSKVNKNFQNDYHHKLFPKSNSSGENIDNSFSPCNTCLSINSDNQLTLKLNSNGDNTNNEHLRSGLTLCIPKSQTTNSAIVYSSDMNDNCKQTHRQKVEKSISPKHSQKKIATLATPIQNETIPQKESPQLGNEHLNIGVAQIPTDTMYTNVANLQQTMLLQQRLFRQALNRQEAFPGRSNFIAPNLSQYHFVSSRQTNTRLENQQPKEDQMEWKVKRRHDGSRYIVKRPTRNCLLRHRTMRATKENNDLTTEDDTISEIKIGRYWTKQERKQHVERSKERRHRQSMIMGNAQRCVLKESLQVIKTFSTSPQNTLHRKSLKKKKDQCINVDTEKQCLASGNNITGLLSVTTV